MHNNQRQSTKAMQPPLRTIQVTDNELIILQAALQHYQRYIADERYLGKGVPLIQQFLARLHEQLPPQKQRIEEG